MVDTQTEKSIRVCFVSLHAYPLFNPAVEAVFGGAEVDLYLLATELAKDPVFAVSFVVGDYGQEPVEIRENVTVIKSLDVTKNLFLHSSKIWHALRQARPDICMTESCSLTTTLIAYFCRHHGCRFVYRTASSSECDGTYFQQNPGRARMVRWAFRQADLLLTQNETDAQLLQKNLGLASTIIRNGMRLPMLTDAPRDTILWAGRSDPVKRPALFLELARQCPQEHFTMICQQAAGDDDYPQWEEQVRQHPNVQFLPRVPYSQIDRYFARAKVLVNTSVYEGFPNTFVGACSCGTPILSLAVNPDQFLTHHQCGLCAHGDISQAVMMLGQLLNQATFITYSQNARRYAESFHDIARITAFYKTAFAKWAPFMGR